MGVLYSFLVCLLTHPLTHRLLPGDRRARHLRSHSYAWHGNSQREQRSRENYMHITHPLPRLIAFSPLLYFFIPAQLHMNTYMYLTLHTTPICLPVCQSSPCNNPDGFQLHKAKPVKPNCLAFLIDFTIRN